MRALVIMHHPAEGPGTLADYLTSRGVELTAVGLHAGGRLPESPEGFDAVVTLGGPMNVYEDGAHPFLREEVFFLRKAIAADVPLLGVCLGAQLIARTCGARVSRAAVAEEGWRQVELTAAGRGDAFFRGMPARFPVFQLHEDTFDVPDGGTLLAVGAECPNQAFRYRSSLALQFHVEIHQGMIARWFENRPGVDRQLRDFGRHSEELARNAAALYDNFLDGAREYQPLGSRGLSGTRPGSILTTSTAVTGDA